MPYEISLVRSLFCKANSNAFAKSMYTTAVCYLSDNCAAQSLHDSISCVVVDFCHDTMYDLENNRHTYTHRNRQCRGEIADFPKYCAI